ncbi:MAG: response regulator [Bacteroidetes bacterium]|nr:response regulator [Bacteroidota bacterium]MBV6461185.1 Transcriptional regulatory protein YpdB [Flavobacteriales bacterium]WKZ75408.1 MAG: response regulator [Vicingaceae bacterium]MCL4817259.1 response regulator [Flavobacteriales bacterium]NOG96006.1 response regulator [Bacteroidota bacterium]
MRTIIIDDERLARSELKSLLKEFAEVEIIADTGNPDEAIQLINTEKPDLIFLDIQMPEKDGFTLLEHLLHLPKVIFVTAFDDFALRAFEVNALDYLLKPVQAERLAEAIKKIKTADKLNSALHPPISNEILGLNDRVFVKDGEKCWFVKLSDVRIFESEGNYVRIYFDKNKPLILKSLNNLYEKLNPKEFFRANRKHIINLSWIENVENWYNGGLVVKLKSGEQIEVSRRQASKLKEVMSL